MALARVDRSHPGHQFHDAFRAQRPHQRHRRQLGKRGAAQRQQCRRIGHPQGPLAGGHLIGQQAQHVLVGQPRVDRLELLAELVGHQIGQVLLVDLGGRPALLAGAGQPANQCLHRLEFAQAVPPAANRQDEGLVVLVEHDVRWLEVAVDDALGMGPRHRRHQPHKHLPQGLHRHRAAALAGAAQAAQLLQHGLQRAAPHQLHHAIRGALLTGGVIDVDEVGLLRRPDRVRHVVHEGQALGRVFEYLDRHQAVEHRVAGLVDRRQIALADAVLHLVAALHQPRQVGAVVIQRQPQLVVHLPGQRLQRGGRASLRRVGQHPAQAGGALQGHQIGAL